MLIREAKLEDAEAIARVHVDTWQTTYQDIIPESYIAKLSYQKRKERWANMLSNITEENRQHFVCVVENNTKLIIAFAELVAHQELGKIGKQGYLPKPTLTLILILTEIISLQSSL